MSGAGRILVVPALGKGRGGGHLARAVALTKGIRAAGGQARLFLSSGRSAAQDASSIGLEESALFDGDPADLPWTCIVLDRFRTPAAEARRWAAIAPIVGIDEGGPLRGAFEYLLDLLPPLPGVAPANLLDPGLLPLPGRRRPSFVDEARSGPLRVLVSFGAEDPAGLTVGAARSLAAIGGLSVDVLFGPLSYGGPASDTRRAAEAAAGAVARVLVPTPDLKERLAEYGLVVTAYGLTAFEAARARVPVLLVSPTRYHERLARSRSFVSAGVGAAAAERVGSALLGRRGAGDEGRRIADGLARIAQRTAAAAPREPAGEARDDAAALLSGFSFPGGGRCPLCGERGAAFGAHGRRALARFADRTYRRCQSCGMLHMVRPVRPAIAYGRDYFFDDYKKQYGRTYLEDFPQLERMGALRAERIAGSLSRRSGRGGRGGKTAADRPAAARPRLLDIGCAYGPFLAAARAAGFDAFGLDPAADAVRFVREELSIPAAVGSFPDLDPVAEFGGKRFDAVTFWYVIEHFVDLGAALEAASEALSSGGVLAFSTPSGSGISALSRLPDFLEKSPADHWTIWEPGRTARFLDRFGFSLEKIVFTGHHPERFPGFAKTRRGGIAYRAIDAASRAFGLGDTFEAYAVKK